MFFPQDIRTILPSFYEDLDVIDEDELPMPPLFDDDVPLTRHQSGL